jgi:UDP-GlcNAc3NAcA epimerase
MKILTVVGARPQFIKAAVVSRALAARNATITERLVHTGQHFDDRMSDVFFRELGIPAPNHNLGIGGGTHGQNTGRMIEGIEEVLLAERPDWAMVYGDTDSTLAGALAAAKLHIPVAHVEAGLRSFNRRMPEEINRVLTDHVGEVLFTPTDMATANLVREGIPESRIRQVGDVMFDAALYHGQEAEASSGILERLGLEREGYLLVTVHRAENTDDPHRLAEILAGLAASAHPLIWPMHPRAQNRVRELGLDLPSHVRAVDPVGYLDMIMLERAARAIVTDSGGVQKEAFFHGVPCITLRDETEWVELVQAGVNRLTGARSDAIARALADPPAFPAGAAPNGLYGDGRAAQRIADYFG